MNPYCSDATSVSYLTDKTCTSHSYPERKKTWGSNLSSFPLCVIWQCSPTEPLPIHLSFSSTGLSDVLGLFGMRHAQINILPGGAMVESPHWVSKKNILSFICKTHYPLMAALILLYTLAPDPYTHLWPWYNETKSGFSISGKEWDWIFGQLKTHVILLSHKRQSECGVCSEQAPFNKACVCTASLVHTHMPYPAAPPHTVTIWKLEIICIRSQLLLDSSYPLHLLFIFPNPFVFPCSVHICSTAATLSFFLPLPWAPPSFVSCVIKPTLFSDYFKRFCQSYDLMTPIIIDYYN